LLQVERRDEMERRYEDVAKHLIVAADFPVDMEDAAVLDKVIILAESLIGSGVYIKVNSVLRAVGYGLITEIQERGLKVFADLKLNDIPATMKTDGELLAGEPPEIVTVMCNSGIDGMKAVKDAVGFRTEVLGVSVLTSFDERMCELVYNNSIREAVTRFIFIASEAGIDGLILSPKELSIANAIGVTGLTFNTPSIRPAWAEVKGDDQARKATPREAILAGANRIVVGRPITQAAQNNKGMPQNLMEAVEWTLKEIAEALEERSA